jgi:hypothetical protein
MSTYRIRTKAIWILAGFLFLLVLHPKAQTTIYPGNSYEGRKILAEKLLSEPRFHDRWGHPSPEQRQLKIIVTGPDDFYPYLQDYLTIYILPVNTPEQLQANDPNIITNIDLALAVPDNTVRFGPIPEYWLKNAGQATEVKLENMSDFWRAFNTNLAFFADFGMSFAGKIGVMYSLSKAAFKTAQWSSFTEPDWVDAWNFEYDYDWYPIPNPVKVKNKRFPEYYRIEVPFEILDEDAEIKFYLTQIVLKNFKEITGTLYSDYRLKEPIVIKQRTAATVSSPVKMIIDDCNVYDRELQIDESLGVHCKVKISKGTHTNFLEVEMLPGLAGNHFNIEKYEMMIVTNKRSFTITQFPVITTANGRQVKVRSKKDDLGKQALISWLSFGVGSSAAYWGGDLEMLSKGLGLAELTSNILENQGSLSFFQSINNAWENQNNMNMFLFPPVENTKPAQNGGVRYRIPVQFTDEPFSGVVYLRAYLQPAYQPPGNLTTYIQPLPYAVDMIVPINTKEKPDGNTLIGIILDSSGSMRSNDPNELRKSATRQIIDLLEGDEMFFLVDFDSHAEWLNHDHWNNWNPETLKTYVDMVDSQGGTDIGKGINEMRLAIQDKVTAGMMGGILLFTDGIGDYNNEADWFRDMGIPIHTISYTGQADAVTMSKIAEKTGGIFLMANNEAEVIEALFDFLVNISGNNKICLHTGHILQDQTISYFFFVDHNSALFNASVTWFQSTVDLQLISPSGVIYSKDHQNNWFAGSNYSMAKMPAPEGGRWEALLTGTEIPPGGEPFVFQVSGDTPNKFNLEVSDKYGVFSINLNKLTGNVDLAQIRPQVLISSPKGRIVDVSPLNAEQKITFAPIDGQGAYNIEYSFATTDLTGNPIQRHLGRSLLVGEGAPTHIGEILHTTGNFITTTLGRWVGNQVGIKCYIYAPGGSMAQPKAIGVVRVVRDNISDIQIIQHLTGGTAINPGDRVELEIKQWLNDGNY